MGKAIAFHLAEEGAKVVILGRKAEIGDAIAGEIKANGGEAMFLTTDVMNRELLEQNLADILKAYGRIDALLNAAGGNMPGATIAPTGTFFDLKIEEFQRVLELNLTGTVLPTQVFLKPMVEQKTGAIVNFSSMAAFRPMTRVAGYAAAKAEAIDRCGSNINRQQVIQLGSVIDRSVTVTSHYDFAVSAELGGCTDRSENSAGRTVN